MALLRSSSVINNTGDIINISVNSNTVFSVISNNIVDINSNTVVTNNNTDVINNANIDINTDSSVYNTGFSVNNIEITKIKSRFLKKRSLKITEI